MTTDLLGYKTTHLRACRCVDVENAVMREEKGNKRVNIEIMGVKTF